MDVTSETLHFTTHYSETVENLNFSDTLYNLSDTVCTGDDNNLDTLINSPYYQVIVYIMYGAIFVIALCGNGMVCYIVQATPRMRTVTNYFIMNLAVGDILMTVFCVPFTSSAVMILQYWPFGPVMCSVVNYMQAVSVLVSAYTLVAISFDRYVAIMWPLRPRLTKRYALVVIGCVWLFALITASPIAIVSKLTQPSAEHVLCDQYMCNEKWPDEVYYGYYSLILMTLQFVLPLSVLVFTYTRIALVVWCKRIPGEAENSRDQRIARSKRKMIKMMVTVVIVFICCWLPLNITVLMLTYSSLAEWTGLPICWLLCHWLAMSHSCYNPIIYCYMNARFRIGFLQALGKIPCFRKYLPPEVQRPRSSMTGFALTGIDATENSLLQRVNTCTTYVSMRQKIQSQPPPPLSTNHHHHHHCTCSNHNHTSGGARPISAPPATGVQSQTSIHCCDTTDNNGVSGGGGSGVHHHRLHQHHHHHHSNSRHAHHSCCCQHNASCEHRPLQQQQQRCSGGNGSGSTSNNGPLRSRDVSQELRRIQILYDDIFQFITHGLSLM
ncbi:RYamide receptor-like [Chrysoperla carnea]|uniref:RYamide receptor-like n=1 Tax=Chrysoperla carnea TaxID=189513 RepID=UPI001D073D27|nr:RYamide receptor-like [Chrysoperla carnea]